MRHLYSKRHQNDLLFPIKLSLSTAINIIEYNLKRTFNLEKISLKNGIRYWTTMSTVGYGDVTARNPVEVFYACVVMFVATVSFGYAINQVIEVL